MIDAISPEDAKALLTAKQWEAWDLRRRGYSVDRIAAGLCIAHTTVRDRLDAADRRLRNAARGIL